jgi:predicted aspartyl protease
MAKVTGSIDDRGRPVIRLEFADDSHLFIVDTGFNGDMIVSAATARAMSLSRDEDVVRVEFGDGRASQVVQAEAKLTWLGQTRLMRVLISEAWHPRAEEPSGLIGTGLLSPHLLLIDFASRLVEIETQ